jgi:hypothetical protein
MRYAIHEYFDMRRMPLSAEIRSSKAGDFVRYPLTPADPVSKLKKRETRAKARRRPNRPMDPVAAFRKKGRETGNRRQVSIGTRVRACLQQLHNNPEGKGGAEERRMEVWSGRSIDEGNDKRSIGEGKTWWSYRDFMLRAALSRRSMRSGMTDRKL